jgi:hypothetical protein
MHGHGIESTPPACENSKNCGICPLHNEGPRHVTMPLLLDCSALPCSKETVADCDSSINRIFESAERRSKRPAIHGPLRASNQTKSSDYLPEA